MNLGKKGAAKTAVIIVIIAVLAVCSLSSAFMLYYKPTFDPEDLPFDVGGNDVTDDAAVTKPGDDTAAVADTGASAGKNIKYVPKDGVYNFLVMGYDHAGINTDVMMVINFDTNTGKIALLQIPRDTYVEVGMVSHKLNAVFGAIKKNSGKTGSDSILYSLVEFKSLLEKNLCIKIHYSAIMDLAGFRNIVDAVGGVTVDIPADMDYEDPTQDLYIHFKAGNGQHLDGAAAEKFVRFRSGYVQADIGRVNAQKVFMTAFLQQVKSNLTVDRLAKIIEQVYSYVTTDMPVADMIYMAKAAFGINLSDITMMTLPGTATWVWNGKQNASYYVMNRPETLKYINEYFNIYNTDISDDIFDKNFVFTNEQDNDVYQIYLGNADYVIESKFSGDEIAGGELTIPMLKND